MKIQLPTRVADYFIVVGLPDGLSDDDTMITSKKPKLKRAVSFTGSKKFKPATLQRYPLIDHSDAEFPKDIPMVFTFLISLLKLVLFSKGVYCAAHGH